MREDQRTTKREVKEMIEKKNGNLCYLRESLHVNCTPGLTLDQGGKRKRTRDLIPIHGFEAQMK